MSTPNADANVDQGKTAKQLWDEEIAAANSGAPNPPADATPPNPAPTPAPVSNEANTPAPDAPKAESQKPAPQAASTPPDDPMANLHPAVRARLEKTDSLEVRLRKVEGHAGNLNSTVRQQAQEIARLNDELKSARQSTVAAGNAAPTQQAVQNAQKSSEKWEALKAEFPEWAEAVEERLGAAAPPVDVNALRDQLRKEVLDEFKKGTLNTEGLQSQPNQPIPGVQPAVDAQDVIDEATEHRVVEAAHPGWLKLVKTPEFVAWYEKQPAEVHKLGNSPIADDAIALLTSYKDFAGKQPNADDLRQKRQQQLQEAASITRGNSNLPAHKSVEDMTPQELWAFEAQQLEAKKRKR